MVIAIPKESRKGERRIPMTPQTGKKLVDLGADLRVEGGMGASSGFSDEEFKEIGARVVGDRKELFLGADVVLRLNKPTIGDVDLLEEGSTHVSFLDPFNEEELLQKLAERNVQTLCMELIPRSTKAQKMDALSSQASLAGYVAVLIAAERLDSVLPMMTTPAGTIYPSRVFVIGVGVAGLQAIATAKRLGARVEAFDTRPVVEEQVLSLGARFVRVDLGERGETKDGYAIALTEGQLEKQREVMAKHCVQADVVITTAQVFGRKAPVVVTDQVIKNMKPGSIIIDTAIESGGNVAASKLGKEVLKDGVLIIGYENLPGRVPKHASQMYASNLIGLIEEFWDRSKKQLVLNLDDEIIKACLVTQQGKIVNPLLLERFSK